MMDTYIADERVTLALKGLKFILKKDDANGKEFWLLWSYEGDEPFWATYHNKEARDSMYERVRRILAPRSPSLYEPKRAPIRSEMKVRAIHDESELRRLPPVLAKKLIRNGVLTFGQLSEMTPREVLKLDKIGPARLKELEEWLCANGMSLKETGKLTQAADPNGGVCYNGNHEHRDGFCLVDGGKSLRS